MFELDPVPSKQMSRIMRGLFLNFDSDSAQIMIRIF